MGTKVSRNNLSLRPRTTRKIHPAIPIRRWKTQARCSSLVPTTPIAAPLIGAGNLRLVGKDHVDPRPACCARIVPPISRGVPAISVPCGFTSCRPSRRPPTHRRRRRRTSPPANCPHLRARPPPTPSPPLLRRSMLRPACPDFIHLTALSLLPLTKCPVLSHSMGCSRFVLTFKTTLATLRLG